LQSSATRDSEAQAPHKQGYTANNNNAEHNDKCRQRRVQGVGRYTPCFENPVTLVGDTYTHAANS